MKRINRSVQRTRRGVALPDDACPDCGTPTKEKRGRLKLPVNGEEITVTEATHLSCPKCHEVVLRFEDARRLRQRALEIYRGKYGLLSADEIRSIRERFGLTQAELARLLRRQHDLPVGGGPKCPDGVYGCAPSNDPRLIWQSRLFADACGLEQRARPRLPRGPSRCREHGRGARLHSCDKETIDSRERELGVERWYECESTGAGLVWLETVKPGEAALMTRPGR